jgi:hypothetical protein
MEDEAQQKSKIDNNQDQQWEDVVINSDNYNNENTLETQLPDETSERSKGKSLVKVEDVENSKGSQIRNDMV